MFKYYAEVEPPAQWCKKQYCHCGPLCPQTMLKTDVVPPMRPPHDLATINVSLCRPQPHHPSYGCFAICWQYAHKKRAGRA